MYVKLFQGILHSSIARNTALRRFFQDLLLLCDRNGDVIMTKDSIALVLRVGIEEVEWGIAELQKPDPDSKNGDEDGRRLIPIDGLGYGWHVVNYGFYRGIKDAEEMREAHRSRQAAYQARKKLKADTADAADTQMTDMTKVTPSEAYSEADADASIPRKRGDESKGFEDFWKKYPRKAGKGNSIKIWAKMKPEDREAALAAVVLYGAAYEKAEPERRKFIPYPATWLNRRQWEDDPEEARRQAGLDEDGPPPEKSPDPLAEKARAIMRGEADDDV